MSFKYFFLKQRVSKTIYYKTFVNNFELERVHFVWRRSACSQIYVKHIRSVLRFVGWKNHDKYCQIFWNNYHDSCFQINVNSTENSHISVFVGKQERFLPPMPALMPQRPSDGGNIAPQKESPPMPPMGGKGGRDGEGSREPGPLNTLLFLRFFHLARRFWNQTCNRADALLWLLKNAN